MKSSYITGKISVNGEAFPVVSTELDTKDFLGAVMVRWGINRNRYRVNPGVYAVGSPGQEADVFVSANYKLSFDSLRKNLLDKDAWILVLDTKGVNVWCAAGKGTFGTTELVNRINLVNLNKIVNHKRLILPQLGATGVAAYKVKEETGFNVHYGPVRAADIKNFLADGYRADKKMRKVNFNLIERIRLIPNDFIYGKYYLLTAMAVFFLLSGINAHGLSFRNFHGAGGPAILRVFLAYFAGIVITPVFLPYLPARLFSVKGFYSGTIVFLILLITRSAGNNLFEILSWFLIITTISSFMAMNFTGSSTYTSLSGVKKEMKISLPLQIGFAITGIGLQIVERLVY